MTPELSVVIPTRNRAELLRRCLLSYRDQTVARHDYEIVVVDDGSTDATPEVCAEVAATTPLRYLRTEPAGTSAAKNLGIFASSGRVVLLADDDDIAARTLVDQHIRAHRTHPDDEDAILGHTGWDPDLGLTPVMDYAMGEGDLLFPCRHLADGQPLDFRFLWAGRTSLKRTFLVHHGVFDQDLPAWEDVELGYRLARRGLRITYWRAASSYMIRPVTFEELCRRCRRQGQGRFAVSTLHPDTVLEETCAVEDAAARWAEAEPHLDDWCDQVCDLEASIGPAWDGTGVDAARRELWDLYRRVFAAFEAEGVVDARAARGTPRPRRLFDAVVGGCR